MKQFYIFLFSLFLLGQTISAQYIKPLDSINGIYNQLPADSGLVYLQELIQENMHQDYYMDLLRLYKSNAVEKQDSTHMGNAYFMLAREFYGLADSMRHYIALADPILLNQKRYEEYFRMYAWDIFVMNREEKNDEVLESVHKYRKMAEELNSPEGLDMIDQAMGDFYFSNQLYDDAERLYTDVLSRMDSRDAPVNRKLNLLALLYNGLPTADKRLIYLEKAEELLNECKKRGMTYLDSETPIYQSDFSIQCGYALNYAEKGDFEKSFQYIKTAEDLIEKYQMNSRKIEITQLLMDYYLEKKEYSNALPYINETEEFLREHNYQRHLYRTLAIKASTLKELNQLKEALDIHEELLVLQDSISQTNFSERFAEMRTRYDVERLEMEKAQMELKEKDTHLKMAILMAGCVILLFAVFGLLYMIRTIQKSKQAYKLAKEKAEEADRMKSTFLANMNHEIRTPLNAIVGFSQVLIEEEDKENKKQFAEIIVQNNELLQRLIGDVLDISKIESNSMSLIYAKQDIPSIMREIYNSTSLRVSPPVELILDEGESIVVETDRNRLVQIITNLLTNAIKHTEEGHIRFGYKVTKSTIRFYVEDTGIGIPEEQLNSIFDRFVQLESGKKGVGLGLAICKGLVDKMGGEIGVTSTYGKGSVFFFEIPFSNN